MTNVAK